MLRMAAIRRAISAAEWPIWVACRLSLRKPERQFTCVKPPCDQSTAAMQQEPATGPDWSYFRSRPCTDGRCYIWIASLRVIKPRVVLRKVFFYYALWMAADARITPSTRHFGATRCAVRQNIGRYEPLSLQRLTVNSTATNRRRYHAKICN